jgi:hypothetical protein
MLTAFVMSWFLTVGFVPDMQDTSKGRLSEIDTEYVATVAEIGLSVTAWDRLTLSASMENYQYFVGEASFKPFRIDYKAGAYFKISENITVCAEHECDHPVSYRTNGQLDYDYLSNQTRFSVTIKGSSR